MEKEEGECRCIFRVRQSSACKRVTGTSSHAPISPMGNARETAGTMRGVVHQTGASRIVPIAHFQAKQRAKLDEETRCSRKSHSGRSRAPVTFHCLNLPQLWVFTVAALKKTACVNIYTGGYLTL